LKQIQDDSLLAREEKYMQRLHTEDFGSHNHCHYFEDVQLNPERDDNTGRLRAYFMLGASRIMYASVAHQTAVKLLATWSASAEVLALSSIEVDLTSIPEGNTVLMKWRGKPVFIRHRTPQDIADAQRDDAADLRDPQTDAERTQNPEWMVQMAICTHLGCVPIHGAGQFGAYFCPCHGSHYDHSGRIRIGPAPLNLEVPEYKFQDAKTLVIG
jgi:ubiquinol-cytochrome c reductase iron-sulfur subunit